MFNQRPIRAAQQRIRIQMRIMGGGVYSIHALHAKFDDEFLLAAALYVDE